MKFKILIAVYLLSIPTLIDAQQKQKAAYDAFSFEKKVTLPVTSDTLYDIVTGDISGWWDHKFNDNSIGFYIEPKPGGGFYEIFNEKGDGVLHANVIYAERGKLLRFDGPLGLSGKAIQIVTSYQFKSVGTDSTLFTVSVHAAGEVEPGIPDIVEKVWSHFIYERLKPFVESGDYLKYKKKKYD